VKFLVVSKKTVSFSPDKTKIVHKGTICSKGYSLSRLKWLIAIFTLMLYGNTIPNHYGFDDIYVTNNEEVKGGVSAIPAMFSSLYANLYEDGKDLKFGYRPIVKSSFALEYSIFGSNPHVSHLINILLYLLTGLILFALLNRMFKGFSPGFNFFIVLIFLAHPAHTEVVASLKNRDEILSLLGALGALHFVLNFSEGKSWLNLIPALVVMMIAYLAKPTVLVFIAIFPLAMFLFTNYKWWRIILVTVLFISAIAFVAIVPRFFLPPAQRPVQFIENPLYFETSFWYRLAAGLNVLFFYLKLLIVPFPLRFYYGYNMIPVAGWADIHVIISLVIHLGLFSIALIYIRRFKELSFAILIYLATIFAFSNIFKPPMGIVADRFLYYPSIGFSIMLVWLIYRMLKLKPEHQSLKVFPPKASFFLLLILGVFFVMTVSRNRSWDTPESLFEADMPKLENSARANFIYAGTMRAHALNSIAKKEGFNLETKNKIEKVFKHLNLATSIYPGYYQAWNMLGSSYMSFKADPLKARDCFVRSINSKPDYYISYFNLGEAYEKLNQPDSALYYYEKTIEVYPFTFQPHFKLMGMYREKGEFEKAVVHGKRGRELKELEEQKFAKEKDVRNLEIERDEIEENIY
jgi:tetratricopeptide (TPR) repeat protein